MSKVEQEDSDCTNEFESKVKGFAPRVAEATACVPTRYRRAWVKVSGQNIRVLARKVNGARPREPVFHRRRGYLAARLRASRNIRRI